VDLTAQDALARTLQLTRQQRLPDVGDEDMVAALGDVGVCIVADAENVSFAAAQAAVSTLTGLVLSCGIPVRLVMPTTPMQGHQPPLEDDELVEALLSLGDDTIPGATVRVVDQPRDQDLVFLVGSTRIFRGGDVAWRLTATAWEGELRPAADDCAPLATPFPMGALCAAAAAAAEPYRAALRLAVRRTGCKPLREADLRSVDRVMVQLAPKDTSTPEQVVGNVDFVSGGAIATAALHALYRVPQLRGTVRVWEPEALAATNLNRYQLMRRSMIGESKTAMHRRWAPDGVTVEEHPVLVDADSLAEMGPWAPHVVVGTDNLAARWLVQRSWPSWLGVGATAGFMAIVSEHELGKPCAGCMHAWTEDVPGEIPTISFVSYWAGLLVTSRLIRHMAGGFMDSDKQMTEAWPDRLDARMGMRSAPIQRQPDCPVGCSRNRP
jgi:hypothetical protein